MFRNGTAFLDVLFRVDEDVTDVIVEKSSVFF